MEDEYIFGIGNKWVRRVLITSAYTLLLSAPYIIRRKIEQQNNQGRYEVQNNENNNLENEDTNREQKESKSLEKIINADQK